MESLVSELYKQKKLLENYNKKILSSNFYDVPVLPDVDLMFIKESIKMIEDNIELLEKSDNHYNNNFNINKFSRLSKIDLKELFLFLENYYIKYRYRLGINKKITFGVEIEFDDYENYLDTYYFLEDNNIFYNIFEEQSVKGFEINSCILIDTINDWIDLRKICQFLRKNKATTNKGNAGGHIHVGLQIFKNEENFDKFLKCYMLYEDILNRFFCGEYINIRKNAKYYAALCKNNVYNSETYSERKKALYLDKINFKRFKERNTIEFRRPNGTLNEIIWQNNINAIIKMILTINKDNFDMEYIDYNINKDIDRIKYKPDSAYHSEINIKKVLEFVDMFYVENIDKLNFLKQYFKNYELTLQKKELIRTKKFWH